MDSTQSGNKGKHEKCVDATVLARNVVLRTNGFSPYQHVLGRDLELSFDFLVLEADVAAVTIPVLDRPSERAVQIRQAARKAFVESQDDKAMRRALVARPRPWRDFKIGDQVAFWLENFDAVMTSIGFTRSTFDVCVNSLRSTAGKLEGILCVHVDDTICGGSGPWFFSKAHDHTD